MSSVFMIDGRDLRVRLNAASADELLDALMCTDIKVPLRTAGRVSAHTERWSICRLLASLARADLLRYPLALLKCERPDFELRMPDLMVGIEITEAIPENQAWLDAVREREHEPLAILQPRFRVGDPPSSGRDIRRIARNELRDEGGWAGNAVERDWAEWMAHRWREKRAARDHPNYTRFAEDWLVIYDNLRGPALTEEEGVALLLRSQSVSERRDDFQRVFIECDKQFWAIGRSGVSRVPITWADEMPRPVASNKFR